MFFTFQHIACEQTKSSSGTGSVKGKPQPIETPGQLLNLIKGQYHRDFVAFVVIPELKL